jgi:hypothetical protein
VRYEKRKCQQKGKTIHESGNNTKLANTEKEIPKKEIVKKEKNGDKRQTQIGRKTDYD